MRTIGRPLMLLAGALCFVAVGCDDEDDIVTGQDFGLRVIHASPDAPAIDVYLAGQSTPVAQNLGYGQATARLTVPTGTIRIELRPAGAATATPAAFISEPVAIDAARGQTAIAAGLLASTSADQRLRLLTFTETLPVGVAGQARVRVVNASPNAPAVGIDIGTKQIEAHLDADHLRPGSNAVTNVAPRSLDVMMR